MCSSVGCHGPLPAEADKGAETRAARPLRKWLSRGAAEADDATGAMWLDHSQLPSRSAGAADAGDAGEGLNGGQAESDRRGPEGAKAAAKRRVEAGGEGTKLRGSSSKAVPPPSRAAPAPRLLAPSSEPRGPMPAPFAAMVETPEPVGPAPGPEEEAGETDDSPENLAAHLDYYRQCAEYFRQCEEACASQLGVPSQLADPWAPMLGVQTSHAAPAGAAATPVAPVPTSWTRPAEASVPGGAAVPQQVPESALGMPQPGGAPSAMGPAASRLLGGGAYAANAAWQPGALGLHALHSPALGGPWAGLGIGQGGLVGSPYAPQGLGLGLGLGGLAGLQAQLLLQQQQQSAQLAQLALLQGHMPAGLMAPGLHGASLGAFGATGAGLAGDAISLHGWLRRADKG